MSGAMLVGRAVLGRPRIQMPLGGAHIAIRSRVQVPIQRQGRWQSTRHGSTTTTTNTTAGAKVEESIPVPNTVAPLPLWERLGPLTSVIQAYARSQQRRPYSTQFFTALLIYFLGDMSAQFIAGDEEYDPSRTGRSLVIGGISAIPSYLW
jgi:protein Mpv17